MRYARVCASAFNLNPHADTGALTPRMKNADWRKTGDESK